MEIIVTVLLRVVEIIHVNYLAMCMVQRVLKNFLAIILINN